MGAVVGDIPLVTNVEVVRGLQYLRPKEERIGYCAVKVPAGPSESGGEKRAVEGFVI